MKLRGISNFSIRFEISLGLNKLTSISGSVPADIWEQLNLLDIHIAVRKCNTAFVVFEHRHGVWVHLATKFTLHQLNEFLRDLVTVEGELQNG